LRSSLLAVAALVSGSSIAVAHLTPSSDTNSRLIKVQLRSDRVQLTYTLIFAEKPAEAVRRGIDVDRDQLISADEGERFAQAIAADLSPGLDLVVDGKRNHPVWARTVVGINSPRVEAAPFAIDLVTWICFSAPGSHSFELRDRSEHALGGETELRVEADRDISLGAITLDGQAADPEVVERMDRGQLAAGWRVAFQSAAAHGPACANPTTAERKASGRFNWTALVAAIGALVFVGISWNARRSDRRPTADGSRSTANDGG
jgi:hypothetical protein